jgi:hypothetical protein
LIGEGWLPSETLFKHPDYIVSSALSMIVPTNNFSAVFLRYLYRVVGASVVCDDYLVALCNRLNTGGYVIGFILRADDGCDGLAHATRSTIM